MARDTCEWVMSHRSVYTLSCTISRRIFDIAEAPRIALPVTHHPHVCHLVICGMSHSYVGHDSFVCDVMMLLIHIFIHADARHVLVCHLVICDLTHSYVTWLCCSFMYSLICYRHVGHDSFICGTWLIRMWCDDIAHSYSIHSYRRTSFCFLVICDTTHSYARHDLFVCDVKMLLMYTLTQML